MNTTAPVDRPDLADDVRRWVAEGVISADQGERILSLEGQPRPARIQPSLVTEALAYVGGAIVLAAVTWVTAQYWSSMSTTVRVVLAGAAAALMLLAGLAVPPARGDVTVRLRSVLWVLSTGALAWWCGLLGNEVWGWRDQDVAVFVSLAVLAYAAVLWWRHQEPLQQLAVMAATIAAAISLTAEVSALPDEAPGVAACVVGLTWLGLGWAELLPASWLGRVLGAAVAVFGAMTTGSATWGNVLTLSVLAGLVTLAVVLRSLPLLAVAAVGSLLSLPRMMDRYFAGSLAAPLVLVLVGLGMIGLAIWLARRAKAGSGPGPVSGPGDLRRPGTSA